MPACLFVTRACWRRIAQAWHRSFDCRSCQRCRCRRENAAYRREAVDHSFLERDYLVTPFPVGRFGDGTTGVYYSARDEVTCERELVFHVEAELAEKGSETFPHPRFYNLIDCRCSGATVGLPGQEKTYPELVSETKKGYLFCWALGLEAVEYGIEGFFTASARNDGGVCVPVFARAALFEPAIRYQVTLTITDAGMQFQRL